MERHGPNEIGGNARLGPRLWRLVALSGGNAARSGLAHGQDKRTEKTSAEKRRERDGGREAKDTKERKTVAKNREG